MSQRTKYLLLAMPLLFAAAPALVCGQNPTPARKPPFGPAAPQSTHYPILLLAFGNDPNWNLRIGQKGPERMDRPGYPRIALEPAEVTHDAADSWTYHAKDSATGVAVSIHLSREACTDATNDTLTTAPPLGGKYSFKASVDHAQIGTLKGCARIAAELFPKINNQPDEEDDDAKKKPPAPTITNFKSPVAVAYINAAQQLVFKRGAVSRVASTQRAYQFAVSHDGKKLLFAQAAPALPMSTVSEYAFDTSQAKQMLRGNNLSAYWSPDDSLIAFAKQQEDGWQMQIWTAPAGASEKATLLYTSNDLSFSLLGWADAHTLFATGRDNFYWIGDDGTVKQTLPKKELCGADPLTISPEQKFSPNPINPDLLLVEATLAKPPASAPSDPQTKTLNGFFLYEMRSKRRVLLSPANLNASAPEWSRDGLQVFFTGQEAGKTAAVYRIFWDGTSLQKYSSGSRLVVGQ